MGHDLPRPLKDGGPVVATFLILTMAGSVAFCVAFVVNAGTAVLGATLVAAFLALTVAAVVASRSVVASKEIVNEREFIADPAASRALAENASAAVARRPFLTRLTGAMLGVLGCALLFPLRSLAPATPIRRPHSKFRKGVRLVREDGTPIAENELETNSVVTAFPEGAVNDPSSPVVLIRIGDGLLEGPPERQAMAPSGYVAYSKICTHAGCPVALYEQSTYQLLCPCHQSLFDALDLARPVSGPAARPLPQLPLVVRDGHLVADGDFLEPIGPDGWDRE